MAEHPEQGGSSAPPPPAGPGWEPLRRGVARPVSAPPAPPAAPAAAGERNCPHCGSAVPPLAGVCPTCGESLKERPRRVRCRQCGKQASSQLVLCPHCGRELRPAPSRLITWGIPGGLLVLALLLLTVGTGAGSPLGWAGGRVEAVAAWISDMGERLDPQLEVIPAAGSANALAAATAASGEPQVATSAGAPVTPTVPVQVAAALTGTAPLSGTVDAAAQPASTETPPAVTLLPTETPLPIQTPTVVPTDTPTALPTETPTVVPTETPTKTPTTAPTKSPTSARAAATATRRATAQATVTSMAGIAETRATGTALGRAAGLAASATPAATPAATAAATATAPLLPTPTPLPPTPTLPPPPPTATPTLYVVKAGDTVLAIALRYGVSQENLLAANGMNADDVRFIQLGQQLIIPLELPAAAAGRAGGAAATAAASSTYTVRSGDTLVAIAARLGIPVDALIAANSFTAEQVRLLRPGQEITVPAPTPPPAQATAVAAAPTATPLPATSYTVRPGDTLLAISQRVGVSVDAILAANGMTLADAPNLRPDQVLVIPGIGQPAAATPAATPTSAAPAPPTAAPASSAIRLDAPQLRSVENGASVSCTTGGELTWLPVPFITGTDRYRLHLGFVSGVDAVGNVQVTWLIEQEQGASNTSWQLDTGLCRFAPQDLGRQWRWYVEVTDANGTPVSLPSAIWGFSWN